MVRREARSLLIAVAHRSNPKPSRIFANSKLFSVFFSLHFLEMLFVVFSLVFAKRSFASVSNFAF